ARADPGYPGPTCPGPRRWWSRDPRDCPRCGRSASGRRRTADQPNRALGHRGRRSLETPPARWRDRAPRPAVRGPLGPRARAGGRPWETARGRPDPGSRRLRSSRGDYTDPCARLGPGGALTQTRRVEVHLPCPPLREWLAVLLEGKRAAAWNPRDAPRQVRPLLRGWPLADPGQLELDALLFGVSL